nr:hypothetical protein CFP56_69108 [Quercus suber]
MRHASGPLERGLMRRNAVLAERLSHELAFSFTHTAAPSLLPGMGSPLKVQLSISLFGEAPLRIQHHMNTHTPTSGLVFARCPIAVGMLHISLCSSGCAKPSQDPCHYSDLRPTRMICRKNATELDALSQPVAS